MIAQAGASGIVTALHQHNRGEVWPVERDREAARLDPGRRPEWTSSRASASARRSRPAAATWRRKIDNYKQSLRNAARAGVKSVLLQLHGDHRLDAHRSDVALPSGGFALRFDAVDFAAYDLFLLEREGAEEDYSRRAHRRGRARGFETLTAESATNSNAR